MQIANEKVLVQCYANELQELVGDWSSEQAVEARRKATLSLFQLPSSESPDLPCRSYPSEMLTRLVYLE
jgi:hypothetical protein